VNTVQFEVLIRTGRAHAADDGTAEMLEGVSDSAELIKRHRAIIVQIRRVERWTYSD
jgi:hypothetical protein